MKTIVILATVALVTLASPADARCLMSYCRDNATATTLAPGERRAITKQRTFASDMAIGDDRRFATTIGELSAIRDLGNVKGN